MADFDRTNSGVAFLVKEKKSERHPDYTGKLDVDGVQYFLDVWEKESRAAGRFVSVSIKKKEKQNVQRVEEKADTDSDVPV